MESDIWAFIVLAILAVLWVWAIAKCSGGVS